MPAIEVIVIIGAVVLGCGSAGLLAVRLSNPLLRGLGWAGGAFAAGGLGAGLLLLSYCSMPVLVAAVAGWLMLLVFVLLHVAMLEMLESKSLFPTLGATLLGLQAIADIYLMVAHRGSGFRITVAGLLVAAQAGQTASQLFRQSEREFRVPARFTAIILFVFMLLASLRSFATAFGLLRNPSVAHKVMSAGFVVLIASVLGVAFGLFWMTTTILTAGLEHMASTDPLTRIYNRRVFLMWCERELTRSQRNDAAFSILMVDLDRFKQINDRYGHQVGDLALCAAVEQMQDSVRGIDVLGRWGGEEFSVLLPRAGAEAALVVAERVRANIARILLPAPGVRAEERARIIQFTASVGVTTFHGGTDDVQSMIQRADACLYRAKASGRNLVLASSEPPAAVHATDYALEPIDAALGQLSHLVQ